MDQCNKQLEYIDGNLHLDGVNLSNLGFKTPFYIYSTNCIAQQVMKLKQAFADSLPLICFAMKSNANLSILRFFADLGVGADTVSGAEIKKALLAGITADKIVFSGVGKTAEEISFAINQGVKQINAESVAELHLINQLAKEQEVIMSVAIRINPGVDAKTHYKISTGGINNKFGIDMRQAEDVFTQRHIFTNLHLTSISVHIGSQITNLDAFAEACMVIKDFVSNLQNQGVIIDNIDFGGGLGISYNGETVIDVVEYAKLIRETAAELNCQIILEPGRFLVGESGVLITSVLFIKQIDVYTHMIVDAGMTDLMRPALYKAKHRMIPLVQSGSMLRSYSVVGPVCESSDVFHDEIMLPVMDMGAQLAILDVGAYGASLANNYNLRYRPAEYAITEDKVKLIRRREEFEDLLNCES